MGHTWAPAHYGADHEPPMGFMGPIGPQLMEACKAMLLNGVIFGHKVPLGPRNYDAYSAHVQYEEAFMGLGLLFMSTVPVPGPHKASPPQTCPYMGTSMGSGSTRASIDMVSLWVPGTQRTQRRGVPTWVHLLHASRCTRLQYRVHNLNPIWYSMSSPLFAWASCHGRKTGLGGDGSSFILRPISMSFVAFA